MRRTFFEEEKTSKLYDKELMSRLFKYLLPYKLQYGIAILLLLFVAFANIAIPYMLKYGIDNYIKPSEKILDLEDNPQIYKDFTTKFDEYIIDKQGKKLLIKSYNLDKLPPSDYHKLKDEKEIKKIFYASFPLNQKNTEVAEKNPDLIKKFGNHYIIKQQSLNQLSSEDARNLQSNNIQGLFSLSIIFLIILILRFVFNYAQFYINQWASMNSIYDLRVKLFAHLQRLPMSYFDKNPVGRMVTRVTNDLHVLSHMLGESLVRVIQDFVMMGAIFAVMMFIDYKLALITFTILPLVFIFVYKFKDYIRKVYRQVRIKLANINSKLSENISGMKTIQLFHKEKEKLKEFKETTLEYYFAELKQLKVFAVFRPLIDVMLYLAIALIIWYGSGQIMADMMSLGVLVAFIGYIRRFFRPISDLSQKYNVMQTAMASLERVFTVMDTDPEDYDKYMIKDEKIVGDIKYKNVSMYYEKDKWILNDINIDIKKGEKIAIVGETGGGKTTLTKLLCRYYPYQKGEILIDGKKVEDYNLQSLRKNIGVVQQDVFIFSDSIRNNISLFDQSIPLSKIKQAAKYVNAHKLISRLPNKYDEKAKERGGNLSAGERQLIAFARVLVSDPSIFILDEATANIDTETELLIQDAVKKVMQNRTSIIIAHRLSTIKNADRIIVIHKGKIAERGTHQTLLKQKGIYYNLYRLQYKGQVK
ncbi:MAG: ABC transporter ATP-binding protein [Candidatus Cloacimonetes bacterium]|nr:ABC transporter ATP-binding protein [Candidatus Cloacimonadota bacterium]